MKKLFSPVIAALFITLPSLIASGNVLWMLGFSFDNPMLPQIAIALSGALIFAGYSYKKRMEAAINSKAFIAVSILYTVLVIWSMLNELETSFITDFVSPKLIFITACVISIIYSILGIAYNTTAPDKASNAVRYVLGIVFTPLIWFLGINLISGVRGNTITLILIIAAAYALVFFIAKLLFIWRLRIQPLAADSVPGRKYYAAVAIAAICLPLLGLFINMSMSGFADNSSGGLFGDFSHPAFFVIAAVNGALLLIPPMKDIKFRLLLFFLKSVGYTYILYFFLVFLPILPFGFLGLIFYGLGILILTPLFVAILQGYHLAKEWIILSKAWSRLLITMVLVSGLVTLPLCMTAIVWGDKANFNTALQYVDQTDFDSTDAISLTRLRRTLDNIKGSLQVTRGMFGFSGSNTPILSELYNSIVLDGKLISNRNALAMDNLFFDAGYNLREEKLSDPSNVNNCVRLLDAAVNTKYDANTGIYRSWINLKLKNPTSATNGEYITTFKLPKGAYISDYYLDVFGTKKEGLLTDRRAALFIYSKIVNTRRDPGLLHYINDSTLELRVFPFAANETRETGFEILHTQGFDFNIDNEVISLIGDEQQKEVNIKGASLLPAAAKSALKTITRAPEYHFVIDSSKDSDVPWLISQVQEYAKANNIQNAEVIFASYKLRKYALADITKAEYQKEGGFNLNMAVKAILSKERSETFPIIIAVTDTMPGAVLPTNVYALASKFPETMHYYALNHNLTVTPYSYEDNRPEYIINEPIINPVLEYKGTYVADNGNNELVLEGDAAELTLTGNQYLNAIALDAARKRELLSGRTASIDLVRASFRSRILTPQTAFIVVETEEQERELLDLQQRVLSNNGELPTVTLSEPPLIICLVIMLLAALLLKRMRVRGLMRIS